MDFTSIDVETANKDRSSICQIGIVQFKDGQIVNRWQSYVNPRDCFTDINISIHGIDARKVADAPTIVELYDTLNQFLVSSIMVSHTYFDRYAINKAYEKNKLPVPSEIKWLDTCRVARQAWPDCAPYRLKALAERFGIKFQHHDAAEDARAAGEVLVRAIAETGYSASDWLIRLQQPKKRSRSGSSERHQRDGNSEGALFGEVAVFTGSLSMSRGEAADRAAEAGCRVATGVTKSTTLLVVGDQEAHSAKYKKAQANMTNGQQIRILREADFLRLLKASEATSA